MEKLFNKHIVILGGSKSGIAVAKLLIAKGASVCVIEEKEMAFSAHQELEKFSIPYHIGENISEAYYGDMLVVSPGVCSSHPIVLFYKQNKRSVYSELEVGSWFIQNKEIAITGTNGKTTVTYWLAHLWKLAKIPYEIGGNIGIPLSSVVMKKSSSTILWYLLEVSSFQLDEIVHFSPHIAVILNISADHLDRYDNDMKKYVSSKFRITMNQTSDDWFVYNADDPYTNDYLSRNEHKILSQKVCFSAQKEVENGIFKKKNNHFTHK